MKVGAQQYRGMLGDDLDACKRGERSRGRWEEARQGRSRLKHWLVGGLPATPLPSVMGVREEPVAGRYGICCSGGGIRSAAFNLGALQVLQDPANRVLQRAAYLAAVSGGSYMAAGLAMVAKVDGKEASDPDLVDDEEPPFFPGSPEEQYLRNRSSYMAPGFSGKARLVARVVLGILINLLFLGSLLFVVGWFLGWVLYGEWLFSGLRKPDGNAITGPWSVRAVVLLGIAALLGLVASLIAFSNESRTRFLHAWAGRFLVLAGVTALIFVAIPELIEWLRDVPDPKRGQESPDSTITDLGGKSTPTAVGGASAAALLVSILVQLRARLTDSRLLTRAVGSGREGITSFLTDRLLPRVRGSLALLAAAIAGPLLLGGILIAAAVAGLVETDPGGWMFFALALATATFTGLSLYGDITSWSLHPFYRRRLSTAFALKRIAGEGQGDEPIAKERDYNVTIPLSRSGVEPVPGEAKHREWPQLVVCAAANVSDPGATPPGRAVTSFTFSPQVIGGPLIGTVPTKAFEEQLGFRQRDFTLPAAVAMSGAALSPSMGKMTRGPLRFLMTLGNARLGVWVPNPRRFKAHSQHSERHRTLYWRPRPLLLLKELLGRNSADAKFLYVTDGGHYENLGLVELLRRGCRDVFCFDASGGRDIQEFGDAIALARTELGVEVSIPAQAAKDLIPNDDGIAQTDCVIGDISFPGGEDGKLVYVRSVLTEAAPHDVRAYHELDPEFPHNSTGDQLYTDQRFEAYRALGRGAAKRALDHYRPPRQGA